MVKPSRKAFSLFKILSAAALTIPLSAFAWCPQPPRGNNDLSSFIENNTSLYRGNLPAQLSGFQFSCFTDRLVRVKEQNPPPPTQNATLVIYSNYSNKPVIFSCNKNTNNQWKQIPSLPSDMSQECLTKPW